jgi:hypothetical protein
LTLVTAVNWTEINAIATCVLAVGLVGAFGAAAFAAQQVRETRLAREAQVAVELLRRWNEDPLVDARRMVSRFKSPDELRDAFANYVATDAPEAHVMYRELDFFEQLGALERRGVVDLELIRLLLGRTLIERWELWQPAIRQAHGADVYPLFGALAAKIRRELRPAPADAAGVAPPLV